MKYSILNDKFFSRLETLAFNLKQNLAGYFGGKHLVSTYGQTVEFADFREYQLGDDIRRIDWNLFSRFEKYFIKLFTDERQMHVQIFIDCSASMGKDNPEKAAYAIASAAALGFLAVHNMDKVSFHLLHGNVSENPFGTIVGKTAFFRAIGQIEEAVFDGETDLEKAITSCPDTGTNNGLSVVISDLMTDYDWKKAVDYLCYKKRQVILVQPLTPSEIEPTFDGRVNLIDSESIDIADSKNVKMRITRSAQSAYNEALRDFFEDIRTFASKRGVDYVSISTDIPIEKVLFGELLKVGMIS